MPRGYDRALYILPFDHRGYFQTKMVGCGAPKKRRRARLPSARSHGAIANFVDILGTGACRTKV